MDRLQKILAAAGLGSRRECEELILQGRVTVDGVTVRELGTKVDVEKQNIYCDGEVVKPEKKVYYLFYKPREVLSTNDPHSQTPRVTDFFRHLSYRVFPVGRLDKESQGLILVTNDGEFAERVLHPRFRIEKVYQVIVKGAISGNTTGRLLEGIWLSEGKMKPNKIKILSARAKSSLVEVSLKEGKNREIRRIFAKVGHPVKKLVRVRIGPFEVGDLKPGTFRPLTSKEVENVFAQAKGNKKRGRNKGK